MTPTLNTGMNFSSIIRFSESCINLAKGEGLDAVGKPTVWFDFLFSDHTNEVVDLPMTRKVAVSYTEPNLPGTGDPVIWIKPGTKNIFQAEVKKSKPLINGRTSAEWMLITDYNHLNKDNFED